LEATRGRVLLSMGSKREAAAALAAAGRMDAAQTACLFQAGCLHQDLGDFDAAISAFIDHLAQNPGGYETMNKLAVCHLSLGRVEEARGYFQGVLDFHPHSKAALLGLQRCRQFNGRGAGEA
jgi:tetratricopeptide (TPR) repeat protein